MLHGDLRLTFQSEHRHGLSESRAEDSFKPRVSKINRKPLDPTR